MQPQTARGRARWASLPWLLVLTAIVLAGHHRLLWRTDHRIDGEAVTRSIPQAAFFWQSLTRGEAPWFNPYEDGGTSPLWSPPWSGPFHPAALLFAVLDPARAINLTCLLSLLLAGMGLFLLARSLAADQPTATLAAVIYTSCAMPVAAINSFFCS